jgi:hypothetical protein
MVNTRKVVISFHFHINHWGIRNPFPFHLPPHVAAARATALIIKDLLISLASIYMKFKEL